jgi:phospholipid/cholesterol/gamma-HCH transport system substrate-binding protein
MVLKYRVMEKLVGFFLILTILIGIAAFAFVGRGKDWFKEHNVYRVLFDEGYYIKPATRVKLFKIDIGRVQTVRLTEDNRVDVKIKVLAQYAPKIRADSVAKVESPTFIGSEYISISPGSPEKPMIPKGTYIPSARKETIADYMKKFELEDKLQVLTKTLENIGVLADNLSDPDKGVPAIVANANHLILSIQDPEEGIPATLASLNQVVARLNDPKGSFVTMLGNFNATSRRFKGATNHLNQILLNFRRISQHLVEGKGTAGKILMTDELNQSIGFKMAAVDEILEDLKKTLSRMPEIIDGVDQALKRVDGVLLGVDKIMIEVPEILQNVNDKLEDVGKILDSVQKNFLIRGNLPQKSDKKTIEIQLR